MASTLEKIQIQRLEERNADLEHKIEDLEGQIKGLMNLHNEFNEYKKEMEERLNQIEHKDDFVRYSFEESVDDSNGRITMGSDNSMNPLSFINDWEVIWAKRYDDENEKRNIKAGHEEGPFIIIDRDEEALYGIYCTSVIPTWDERLKSSYFIGDAIDCFKETYIDFSKIKRLTPYHYIKKVDKISNAVRNKITKKLSIALQKGYSNYVLRNNSLVYYVKKNEIIQIDGKYYFITKEDADFYYAIEANRSADNKDGVLIDDAYYTFSFLDNIQIRKVTSMIKNDYNKLKGNADDFTRNSTYTIVAMLNEDEERAYKKYQYVYFNKGEIGEEYTPDVYDVVEFDDRLFYIYGEEENDYQIIELYINKDDCPLKGREEIEIDGEKYYSEFDFLLIEKANEFEYITASSELDRYSMKSQFKYHRKQNRKKETRLKQEDARRKVSGSKFKNLKHKTMMTDKNGSTFVVITRNYNTIRTVNFCTLEVKDVNLDDYKNSPFEYKETMKDEDYYAFKARMRQNDELKKNEQLNL